MHENEIAPPAAIEDSLRIDAGDYNSSIVTDEQYKAEHPQYVDNDGKEIIHLSEDVFKATTQLMMAEVGDKTFCLIIIFTISWANWNSASDQDFIEIEV